MVFVFIWLPKRKNGTSDIGHGSMQVGRSYVSNWPGELSSIFFSGRGSAAPDFNSDKTSEHGLPQLIYRIKGLDEQAMEDRWAEMKTDLTYSFPTYNCFTTVAEVLSEGMSWGESIVGDTYIPHGCVIAHPLLISYVYQVTLAVEGRMAQNMLP